MPRNQNSLMTVVALGIGILTFFFSIRAMTPRQKIVEQKVIIASRNVQSATVIVKEDLDFALAPKDIDPAQLFSNPTLVLGRITNRAIPQGSPIRSLDLISKEDNLAGLIPEGYQAVTIKVATMPVDLGSMLRVGNRIDILLTYNSNNSYNSITLMKNIKVIGIAEKEQGFIYLTLAITPDAAKIIAYAEKRGSLTVAIRSLSEREKNTKETFYPLEELFRSEVPASTKAPEMENIEIIRGLNKETYRFVKGQLESKKGQMGQPESKKDTESKN